MADEVLTEDFLKLIYERASILYRALEGLRGQAVDAAEFEAIVSAAREIVTTAEWGVDHARLSEQVPSAGLLESGPGPDEPTH